MKKMLLFLFTVVISTGCKKDTRSVIASLEGSWELVTISGNFTINYSPGNGNTLAFTKSAYQRFKSGQLVASGKYSIIRDGNAEKETGLVIPPGQYEYRINYEDNSSSHQFFNLSKDTLVIISGFFPTDGGASATYRRL